jgi:hypothetical protein
MSDFSERYFNFALDALKKTFDIDSIGSSGIESCLVPLDTYAGPKYAMSFIEPKHGTKIYNADGPVGEMKEAHDELASIAKRCIDEPIRIINVVVSGSFELVEDFEAISNFLDHYKLPPPDDVEIESEIYSSIIEPILNVSPRKKGGGKDKDGNPKVSEVRTVFDPIAPIRVFTNNDTFGLFTLADPIAGNYGFARPREQWSVYAGQVSTLLLGTPICSFGANKAITGKHSSLLPVVDLSRIFVYNDMNSADETTMPDNVLPEDTVSNCIRELWKKLQLRRKFQPGSDIPVVVLVAINETALKNNSEVRRALFEQVWKDGYQYRTASNSFNEDAYGDLIYKVMHRRASLASADVERDEGCKTLTNNIKKNGSVPNIVDFLGAVIDVLNRPLRNVPGFRLSRQTEPLKVEGLCAESLIIQDAKRIIAEYNNAHREKTKTSGREIVFEGCVSKAPNLKKVERFFYPIDLHNLRLARRIVGWPEDTANLGKAFAQTNHSPLIHMIRLREYLNGTNRSPGVLNIFMSEYKNYPWRVKCEILPGQGTHILALVFDSWQN